MKSTKRKTATIVLTNGKECNISELKEARAYAVEQYYKAEKRRNNAEIRMKEAKDIVQGLDGRIRLLGIMERDLNEK